VVNFTTADKVLKQCVEVLERIMTMMSPQKHKRSAENVKGILMDEKVSEAIKLHQQFLYSTR